MNSLSIHRYFVKFTFMILCDFVWFWENQQGFQNQIKSNHAWKNILENRIKSKSAEISVSPKSNQIKSPSPKKGDWIWFNQIAIWFCPPLIQVVLFHIKFCVKSLATWSHISNISALLMLFRNSGNMLQMAIPTPMKF